MKTSEFLSKEISSLIEATSANKSEISSLLGKSREPNEYDRKKIKSIKASMKRDKARQAFLKTCLLYINTSPNEDYLKREVERISNRINLLLKNYKPLSADRHTNSEVSKHKKDYEKEMNVSKIRTQLTTLNFLLN